MFSHQQQKKNFFFFFVLVISPISKLNLKNLWENVLTTKQNRKEEAQQNKKTKLRFFSQAGKKRQSLSTKREKLKKFLKFGCCFISFFSSLRKKDGSKWKKEWTYLSMRKPFQSFLKFKWTNYLALLFPSLGLLFMTGRGKGSRKLKFWITWITFQN